MVSPISLDNADFLQFQGALIADIQALVRIPSMYDAMTVTQAMPYGRHVQSALEFLTKLAMQDGFEIRQYDGHALAIILNPDGWPDEERIDIVSHVDVVDPGVGWSEDPFSGRLCGKELRGRGTQDMKSCLMITYHALRYLKDHRIPLKRQLRVVIGCDEERTMGDMEHYLSMAGQPAFAFTPDGYFPMSIGEKGALMWRLSGEMDSIIENFEGGAQCNMVPPWARCSLHHPRPELFNASIQQRGLRGSVSFSEGLLQISLEGKAAHASNPESGLNAVTELCAVVAEVTGDPLSMLIASVFGDYLGNAAKIACDIPPMGRLTLNLGVLRIAHGEVYAEIDSRYPLGVTSAELGERIGAVLAPLVISLDYDAPPILNDPNSPFIGLLLENYRESSGDTVSLPFISGGVTYSKVIDHCVAYGPHMPGEKSLAHRSDEFIEVDRLIPLLNLYIRGMLALATYESKVRSSEAEKLRRGEAI